MRKMKKVVFVAVIFFIFSAAAFFQYLPGLIQELQTALFNQPAVDEGYSVLWQLGLDKFMVSTPSVYDRVIYVQTRDKLYAVQEADGKVLWETTYPDLFSFTNRNISPLVADGIVFFADAKGGVNALDIASGKLLWRVNTSNYQGENSSTIESMVVADHLVFVARWNDSLIAYDARTGTEQWKVNAPDRSGLYLGTWDGKVIFVRDDKLTLYEPQNGRVVFDYLFDTSFSGALFDGPIAYMYVHTGSSSNEVFAFDLEKYELLWQRTVPIGGAACLTSVDDSLIFSGNGIARIDKASGTIRWKNFSQVGLHCGSLIDHRVYARKEIGDLYVFNFLTGEIQSKYNLSAPWLGYENIDPIKINEDQLLIPATFKKIQLIFPNNK